MNLQAYALPMLGNWLSLRTLYGWYPGYPSDMPKAMFAYKGGTCGNQNLDTLHGDDAAGIRWIYPPAAHSLVHQRRRAASPAPQSRSRTSPGPRSKRARPSG